jgi:hypothetical protein
MLFAESFREKQAWSTGKWMVLRTMRKPGKAKAK